jgi:hypothetical protein
VSTRLVLISLSLEDFFSHILRESARVLGNEHGGIKA